MLLGVEHIVLNTLFRQQLREQFGVFNRGRAEQNRLSLRVTCLDVLNDGLIFLRHRTVDLVLLVDSDHLAMCRNNDSFKAINVLELVRFSIRRTRHAGELLVHAEVVLEGNRRHRLIFVLNAHAFLSFDGLVNTFAPATSRHQTARKFVHDDDFTVLHHILLIALEERMSLQGGHQVMHQNDVLRRVKRFAGTDKTAFCEDLFELHMAGLGDIDLMGFFIYPIVAFALFLLLAREERRNFVDSEVKIRIVIGRPRNDERRTRLVNQNGVHFVDNRKVETALTARGDVVLHVVAQIVKAELIIRAVRNVGRIGFFLNRSVLLRKNLADGKPEPVIKPSHPVRIARSQIVVDGHDMHAFAGQSI